MGEIWNGPSQNVSHVYEQLHYVKTHLELKFKVESTIHEHVLRSEEIIECAG